MFASVGESAQWEFGQRSQLRRWGTCGRQSRFQGPTSRLWVATIKGDGSIFSSRPVLRLTWPQRITTSCMPCVGSHAPDRVISSESFRPSSLWSFSKGSQLLASFHSGLIPVWVAIALALSLALLNTWIFSVKNPSWRTRCQKDAAQPARCSRHWCGPICFCRRGARSSIRQMDCTRTLMILSYRRS